MERNNGKIAIAIVAMFVVALSIVGVTYAYFVATVRTNTTNNSVEVKAGILKITYDEGQTLTATNIVPGWKSDNDMIYDPVHSLTTKNGETRITAVSKSALGDTVSANATTPVGPVTFKVTDASTKEETAYYGIRLVNVSNGLYTEGLPESENDDMLITLTNNAGLTAVTDYALTNDLSQNLAGVYSISTDDDAEAATVHEFTLSAHYIEASKNEDPNDDVQTATGVNIAATVEVVGLNLVSGTHGGTDARYADAVGNTYNASFELVQAAQ